MHTFIARLWPVFVVAFVAVYASGTSLMLAKTAVMQEDPNLDAIVTGGGTVNVAPGVASFGLNAKRPAGYLPGQAQGRINYDKHFAVAGGRHVNAPVTKMQATTTNTPPNHTGGDATLVGDCTQPNAECANPAGTTIYVLVYVVDSADNGANDTFEISFCTIGTPELPDPNTFPGAVPTGCTPLEGGNLRSGNVQIRPRP